MAERFASKELQRFARLGAEARLSELELERAAILRSFPDLARRGTRGGSSAAAPRRRSNMSAAARKAVSVRMKKYWASRRKAKAAAKNAGKST